MDNKILGLLAFMLVMAPAFAASTVTLGSDYACGANLDNITVTVTGLGANNVTNITYDGALGSTATVYWNSCKALSGTYVNATHVTSSDPDGAQGTAGNITCYATVVTKAYGQHSINVHSYNATNAGGTADTIQLKCYAVTDLVNQGVDIAGKFMNALVDQSGNIAQLVILGLIVTLLVGLIAAVGTIFVVFKLK